MTFEELSGLAKKDSAHRHVFGPPLSREEEDAWIRRWPAHLLPDDLRELLRKANGIHLCADVQSGRAYQGLSPLSEWDLARKVMWGESADPATLGDNYLAISYHTDGSAYVVLDVKRGRYFFMDSSGADETCPIGASVGELLAWLWDARVG